MSEILQEMIDFDDFFKKFKEFIKEQNEQKNQKNDYNVITALLSQNDEVRLHSRFIYSLINPNGKHYQETFFLKKFLECIGINDINDFNYDNAEVKKEFENIDLYITDGCKHVIIENKINAYDQKHQISRYIDIIKNINEEADMFNDIYVVYLTIDCRIPSKSSLHEWIVDGNFIKSGNTKIKYINITYKKDILNWINDLIKYEKIPNNLRFSIENYKEVVGKVTKIEKRSKIMDINEYLLKEDNFENLVIAAKLVKKFESLKGEMLKNFFENIDKEILNNNAIKCLDEEIINYSYEENDCNKWFTGRPRNYNIGTFFKIENKPVIFGILVSKAKLYFVVRIDECDKNSHEKIRSELSGYKDFMLEKNNKKNHVNLVFHCKSLGDNLNIFANIDKKEILSLLCEKKYVDKIVKKCLCFATELDF